MQSAAGRLRINHREPRPELRAPEQPAHSNELSSPANIISLRTAARIPAVAPVLPFLSFLQLLSLFNYIPGPWRLPFHLSFPRVPTLLTSANMATCAALLLLVSHCATCIRLRAFFQIQTRTNRASNVHFCILLDVKMYIELNDCQCQETV